MRFRFAIYASFLMAFFISTASAQVGELRGRVLLRQAHGSSAPLAGAVIDLFRTDIAGKYETRTNRSGEFVYAGVPYSGTYILSVSAQNARSAAIYGVQAGRGEVYEMTLNQGDGIRLTLEEAQAAASAPGANGDKQEGPDEILSRAFKAGNDALRARRYDDAIKYFDEALAAVPNQPVLWTNKSLALKARGIDSYNSALRSSDEQTKRVKMEAAHADWRAASDAAAKAVESVKVQPIPTEQSALRLYNLNKIAALGVRAEALRLVVIYVDASRVDEGLAAFQEYVHAETDSEKRIRARVDAARMLLDANVLDKAIEEYRGILVADSENADAMLGLGLALYRRGNKSELQEAAGYLNRFVEKVPDTHPQKQLGVETLEKLDSTGR